MLADRRAADEFMREMEGMAVALPDGAKHLHRSGGDFRADAVAGDKRDDVFQSWKFEVGSKK